ncbi:conserved hypothetical protein [Gammaproteobacteria bacterium]
MKTYAGIDHEERGGMTPIGGLIRDAWVFGILPEGEGCAGWTANAMQIIYGRVSQIWEQHGYAVANLPDELRERHERIHRAAIQSAMTQGWEPSHNSDGQI